MILTRSDRTKLISYLVSIIVLLGLILLVTLLRRQDTETRLALGFEADQIVQMTIQSPESRAELERTEEGWAVTGDNGLRVRGRTSRIDDLLTTLSELRILRTAATSASSGAYGLGEGESTRITVTLNNGAASSFAFGTPTSVGGEYFFQGPNSESVEVIDGSIGFYLSQGPAYWTDLRFWPDGLSLDDLLSVEISGFGRPSRTLSKDTADDGTSFWRDSQDTGLSEEEETSARQRRANLVRSLTSMEFQEFLAPEDAQFANAEVQGTVRIQGVAGQSWTIELEEQDAEGAILAAVRGSGIEERFGLLSRWRFEQIYPPVSETSEE